MRGRAPAGRPFRYAGDRIIESSPWSMAVARLGRDPQRAAYWLVALLAVTMAAFSVAPVVNNLRGSQNKDYNLWYETGRSALCGTAIYPTDHRPFPFMYPPSCAAILGLASIPGERAMVVMLLLTNSAAWAGSIVLSVYLATGKSLRQHPLLYLGPTLVVIPFVHDTYLLGQPVLVLLACLLGAFACLRNGRPWFAGMLIGAAAAVKAFPILALGYLVYRRYWKGAAATLLSLAFLLLILPLPMRGTTQTWSDLAIWTRGMLLKYDQDTIAQRPERSYSFKNQSIIALANRVLRSVPADGEAKDGWKVNLADLDFRSANAAILVSVAALCAFYVAVMPGTLRRSSRTDAIEAAMLLLLILAFNPLSFDYTFVWLLYPLALVLALVLEADLASSERRASLAGLIAALVIFALALPFRRTAQAYGNLLIADLLLFATLGWQLLRTQARPASSSIA